MHACMHVNNCRLQMYFRYYLNYIYIHIKYNLCKDYIELLLYNLINIIIEYNRAAITHT